MFVNVQIVFNVNPSFCIPCCAEIIIKYLHPELCILQNELRLPQVGKSNNLYVPIVTVINTLNVPIECMF